jgi:replicative DNA helicase
MTVQLEKDLRTRAEQRVIASLLQDETQLRHCRHLMPSDFSHDTHGMFYLAIVTLIQNDADVHPNTVFEVLEKQRPSWRATGIFAYLCSLHRMAVVPRHAGVYAAAMLSGSLR